MGNNMICGDNNDEYINDLIIIIEWQQLFES